MVRLALTLTAVAALTACPRSAEVPKRVVLSRAGGSTFELMPAEGQLQYCLVYTVASNNVTRQLTMSAQNMSFECPAGVPIGHHPYRVPVGEGKVRIFVLFTSQPINAGSVAQQLVEAPDRMAVTAMNLRLPGNAVLEILEFTPEEDVAAPVGHVLGDGGPPEPPSDGG